MRSESVIITKANITDQVKKWWKRDYEITKWALAKWEAYSIFEDGVDELVDRLVQGFKPFSDYTENEIIVDLCQEFEGESHSYWNDFVEHVEGEFK